MSEFVYRIKVLVKVHMSVVNDVEQSCVERLNLTQSIEQLLEVINCVVRSADVSSIKSSVHTD